MTKLAFCAALIGLDGVGKTTLLSEISKASPQTLGIIGRGQARTEKLVAQHMPRRCGDHRDWLERDFNHAVAIACALDYVDFYRTHVEPALNRDTGSEFLTLVTDRHAVCFQAFAQIVDPPSHLALKILAQVPPPDLFLKVMVSTQVTEARIIKRGGNDLFEHPECQAALDCGYSRVLTTSEVPVVEIDNTGSMSDTVESALIAIQNHQRTTA